MQKEISNLNSKVGIFLNIPAKVFKESSNVCNAVFRDIWNFDILEKQNFPRNLKLVDVTPVDKKKDPTLFESYQPVSVLLLSLNFLKELSRNSFQDLLIIFYFHPYVVTENVLTPNN